MLSHPLPPPLPSTPRALNSSGAKGRAGRSLAREGSFISIVRRDILAIPRGNRISSRRPPHLSSSSQWPAIIMRNLAEQSDQRQSHCRGLWNCRATHIRHPPSPPLPLTRPKGTAEVLIALKGLFRMAQKRSEAEMGLISGSQTRSIVKGSSTSSTQSHPPLQ